jgi:3-hydroxypropanoate dehydrogenase
MASKEKLKPAMYEGNIEKTMTSPVTAIFAYDTEFYEKMSELFPHGGMQDLFKGNKELAHETAVRNSNLQAAYFMVVARALGLDCGPMSGFDKQKVDGIFFTNTSWRSNFLCNLGYGNSDSVKPRLPRLSFDTACQVI